MTKFIELTVLKEHPDSKSRYEEKMLLNTSEIVGISNSDQHTGAYIELRGSRVSPDKVLVAYTVETYDEIKEMLAPNVISVDVGDIF